MINNVHVHKGPIIIIHPSHFDRCPLHKDGTRAYVSLRCNPVTGPQQFMASLYRWFRIPTTYITFFLVGSRFLFSEVPLLTFPLKVTIPAWLVVVCQIGNILVKDHK